MTNTTDEPFIILNLDGITHEDNPMKRRSGYEIALIIYILLYIQFNKVMKQKKIQETFVNLNLRESIKIKEIVRKLNVNLKLKIETLEVDSKDELHHYNHTWLSKEDVFI